MKVATEMITSWKLTIKLDIVLIDRPALFVRIRPFQIS